MISQVIAAEGEQKSSKALKEASDIISTSPAALQLRWTSLFSLKLKLSSSAFCRYLQTLSGIAAEKNSTIIFPLPMGEIYIYFFLSVLLTILFPPFG